MLGPNWRDREFEVVEELSVELRRMLSMLGHVDGAPARTKDRSAPAKEEIEVHGFML